MKDKFLKSIWFPILFWTIGIISVAIIAIVVPLAIYTTAHNVLSGTSEDIEWSTYYTK